jgi:hypothetical protein
MSKRLADRFAACREAKRTAFVGFVTAGYPKLEDTVPALLEMEKSGCDVIELGVPFSDPMADGSVIEAASVVALKNGVQYEDTLKYCSEARAKGLTVPVLMMGYYNSFLAAGVEETCKAAKAAGVDGFIIVDLPCEEAWRIMAPAAAANDLSLVPLASPTSGAERIAQARAAAPKPAPPPPVHYGYHHHLSPRPFVSLPALAHDLRRLLLQLCETGRPPRSPPRLAPGGGVGAQPDPGHGVRGVAAGHDGHARSGGGRGEACPRR